MTNELLAELIGRGDNDELLPLLWEKMRKYYTALSEKYARDNAARCVQCGITHEDIKQECYFAMLDSIRYYNNRKQEQAALLFITFCDKPFRTHAAGLIGIRTEQQRNEPLNTLPLSLDESIEDDEGETNTTRGELIADSRAEKAFEDLEQADYNRCARRIIAAALSDSPLQYEVIKRYYYYGDTMRGIANGLNLSLEDVRREKEKAMRKLRRCRELSRLREINAYKHIGLENFRHNGSIEEQIIERREMLEHISKRRAAK